ncbi:MAG TPA: Ig-like domain-containing protein, partial [Pirellulales bacterium]|nr:Ig-like domain-containing protein [Pirellulales bacterium]
MKPLSPFAFALFVAVTLSAADLASAVSAETSDGPSAKTAGSPAKAPGLGKPGKLTQFEVMPVGNGVLRGPDARKQLLVDARYASGQARDVTRRVRFSVKPADIVVVDANGFVTPLSDGQATITVTGPGKLTTQATVSVENFAKPPAINFPNHIVPVFSKYGCNAGGCHGKATGQNGFKLSLLGFYPNDDYEYLVKEARGRRVFPAAPEQSLLLLKSTNTMAHGGGKRLDPEGYEYRLLCRWMEQGMHYGKSDDPTVERIEVFPAARSMERGGEQQLAVLAHYTDGSTEDVTHIAQYEPNDGEMAEATSTGLVRTLDQTGDVAVMVRFQGQVAVFRASMPLGLKVANLPPPRNFIDELVFEKLKSLGIPPAEICDDATFLRRVTVDI